jgi:hypothetical protein
LKKGGLQTQVFILYALNEGTKYHNSNLDWKLGKSDFVHRLVVDDVCNYADLVRPRNWLTKQRDEMVSGF